MSRFWDKTRGCTAILASVGTLLLGAIEPAWADAIGFDQVAYSYNGNVIDPYSQTGEAVFSYTPTSTLQYENIVSNGQWIVQNQPLLPNSVVGSTATSQAYFNLGLVGGSSGTNFSGTSLSFFSTASTTPLLSAPVSGISGSAIVGTAAALTNSGVPSGITAPAPPAASGINWSAISPFTNVQTSFHTGVPNVTQEMKWCGPGAATNSLSWLGKTDSQSLNQAQADLAAKMNNDHDGNWDDAEASGKLQYIMENGLPLVVHYTGGEKLPTDGNYTDPVTGLTAQNDGAVSAEWLVQQMQAGQDIELMTGTHWVVLEGIIGLGDVALLEYRDDPFQHGMLTTPEEQTTIDDRHLWTYFADGMTNIGNGPEVLLAAVAESVPEPSTSAILCIPIAMVLYRRRPRHRL